MRARLMTMPLATGSAPPLSPVPEPRATKGIFSRWHTRTIACTCVGGGGQQHGQRQHPEHGQTVALVGAELLGLGDQAGRADDGAKFIEDAGFHVLLSSHGEPSAGRGLNQQPRSETRPHSGGSPARWNATIYPRFPS